MRYLFCVFSACMKKSWFLITLVIISSFESFSQDSTTYLKILNNSQWIYVTIDNMENSPYYYAWSKKDLQEMVVDMLNKNGIHKVMRLNKPDQLGINDILFELSIDTSAFSVLEEWMPERAAKEKWRILKVEVNIKKLAYFTGIDESYLTIIERKFIQPYIIPLSFFAQSISDKVLYDIEDLVLQFVLDYEKSKNM